MSRFEIAEKLADSLHSEMLKLSDSDLKNLIRQCGKMTDTNCGWRAFGIKDVVSDMAKFAIAYEKCPVLHEPEQKGLTHAK